MKKYEMGNIVETKEGDKCILIDITKDEALVFNLSKLHPDTIKLDNIEKKLKESNCTVVIEKKHKDEDEETEQTECEKVHEPNEKIAELLKIFGEAATELGNICKRASEGDTDE